jgi:type IX secretion system PorP/SprF family membrane protein
LKKYLKIYFLIFISGSLFWKELPAQDPMFSQFMFSQTYFNPAYAGTSPNPRIIGGYRNQWPGMNNAFSTYYLSYDQLIKDINSGVGISLSRDAISNANFNVTGLDVSYNYQFNSS